MCFSDASPPHFRFSSVVLSPWHVPLLLTNCCCCCCCGCVTIGGGVQRIRAAFAAPPFDEAAEAEAEAADAGPGKEEAGGAVLANE